MTTTSPTLPAALTILEATPGTLRALLAGVPAEMLTRDVEGAWSVRDVLAHLFVNDAIALVRFKRMTDEEAPAIEGFDEQETLAASPARKYTIPTLLYHVTFGRSKLTQYLRGLSSAQLERTGEHSQVGTMRGVELVHQIAHHDLNHIRQIATLLAEQLDEARGPLRAF